MLFVFHNNVFNLSYLKYKNKLLITIELCKYIIIYRPMSDYPFYTLSQIKRAKTRFGTYIQYD
jgi:hypothetical protein